MYSNGAHCLEENMLTARIDFMPAEENIHQVLKLSTDIQYCSKSMEGVERKISREEQDSRFCLFVFFS